MAQAESQIKQPEAAVVEAFINDIKAIAPPDFKAEDFDIEAPLSMMNLKRALNDVKDEGFPRAIWHLRHRKSGRVFQIIATRDIDHVDPERPRRFRDVLELRDVTPQQVPPDAKPMPDPISMSAAMYALAVQTPGVALVNDDTGTTERGSFDHSFEGQFPHLVRQIIEGPSKQELKTLRKFKRSSARKVAIANLRMGAQHFLASIVVNVKNIGKLVRALVLGR